MAAIDVSALSSSDLAELIRQAEHRREQLRRKPADQVRKRIEAEARRQGYTVGELFGVHGAPAPAPRRRRMKRAKPPAKYRNPDDPRQTWSGMGRKPAWFQAHLRRGRTVADLIIPGKAQPHTRQATRVGRRTVVKTGRAAP